MFRKRALQLVALLRNMTCNLRHPTSLRHPVPWLRDCRPKWTCPLWFLPNCNCRAQIYFLKKLLAVQFAIYNQYTCDFSEFLPGRCWSYHMPRTRTNSQKSAYYLIDSVYQCKLNFREFLPEHCWRHRMPRTRTNSQKSAYYLIYSIYQCELDF